MVNQNVSHRTRRHREKMGAILKILFLSVGEFQIRFMNQGGRLQSVSRRLAVHITLRHPAQLVINERHQLLESVLVALAPIHEQARNLVGTGIHH